MAGACIHLEEGALKLYAGPPKGGLREVQYWGPTEKVQRPLGLTILGRFPSLWGDSTMSQQPKLEVVPEHKGSPITSILKKMQAPCPGFQWNSQRRM